MIVPPSPFYFIVYIVSFILSIFLLRWIFRIDRIVDNLDKQYLIQIAIAKKLGVDKEELSSIDDIEEYVKGKSLE